MLYYWWSGTKKNKYEKVKLEDILKALHDTKTLATDDDLETETETEEDW